MLYLFGFILTFVGIFKPVADTASAILKASYMLSGALFVVAASIVCILDDFNNRY